MNEEKPIAFCMKCRVRVEPMDPHYTLTRNGRTILQGHCPLCYTKLSKIVKNPKES